MLHKDLLVAANIRKSFRVFPITPQTNNNFMWPNDCVVTNCVVHIFQWWQSKLDENFCIKLLNTFYIWKYCICRKKNSLYVIWQRKAWKPLFYNYFKPLEQIKVNDLLLVFIWYDPIKIWTISCLVLKKPTWQRLGIYLW